jgi:argininosuccinate lyase
VVGIAAPLIAGTRFDRERVGAGLERGHLDATSLMEALIADGVPQRTAHETVGHLVREALSHGIALGELSDAQCTRHHPGWHPGLRSALGAARAVERMRSAGSTAPAAVAEQVAAWRDRLGPSS